MSVYPEVDDFVSDIEARVNTIVSNRIYGIEKSAFVAGFLWDTRDWAFDDNQLFAMVDEAVEAYKEWLDTTSVDKTGTQTKTSTGQAK